MQIAYLISAYRDPEQLTRLVRKLQHPEVVFYIHVDKKVSIEPFQKMLPASEQVHYVRNRQRVYWKGFSQVEMMLVLMQAAMDCPFQYAVYLSEADYPLRANEAILHFFAQKPSELISYWKLADRARWLRKIQYYYFHDWGWFNPRTNSLSLFLFRVYNHTVKQLLFRRSFPFPEVPYGGSEYFSLSRKAVRYLLDYCDQHAQQLNWYRWSDSPIEHFFHTILLNSPHRDKVIHYEAYQEWSQTTTPVQKLDGEEVLPEIQFHYRYMDWSRDRERPAILDEKDYEYLIKAEALFARKVNSRRSGRLLDQLDAWMLK